MNTRDLESSVGKKDVNAKDPYRSVAVVSGLILVGVAVMVAPDIFSVHNPDPEQLLRHSAYSALIVLCAVLLIKGRIPEVLGRLKLFDLKTFDRFQYTLAQTMMSSFERMRGSIELSVFDRFQYLLAQTIVSLASNVGKIHTGDLNLNMIGFLVGLTICLISVLGFLCF